MVQARRQPARPAPGRGQGQRSQEDSGWGEPAALGPVTQVCLDLKPRPGHPKCELHLSPWLVILDKLLNLSVL